MSITFVNLTKHEVKELISGTTILPSGTIARITTNTDVVQTINNIPIVVSRCTAIAGIPEPKANTMYIVASLVADNLALYPEYACRKDIVSPCKVKREGNKSSGDVIGCEMFRGLSNAYPA